MQSSSLKTKLSDTIISKNPVVIFLINTCLAIGAFVGWGLQYQLHQSDVQELEKEKVQIMRGYQSISSKYYYSEELNREIESMHNLIIAEDSAEIEEVRKRIHNLEMLKNNVPVVELGIKD